MRKSPIKGGIALTGVLALTLAACSSGSQDNNGADGGKPADGNSYTIRDVSDGTTEFTVVENPEDGETLSFAKDSGFELIEEKVDGVTYAFKDMNGNGKLDPWEDWRLSAEERAADLAPQLSIEQVSGLMLFSDHERAPGDGLTAAQKEYLEESHLRNILFSGGNDPEPVVTWTNQLQSYVESLASEEEPYIPVSFSTNPRSEAVGSYDGAAGAVSQWPTMLGMAATFDVDLVREYGRITSHEYRALGLQSVLGPQIDLATDPRWPRLAGTLGEDADLAAEMTAAFVEGAQGTFDDAGENQGWGDKSITTVIKHFPGDGIGESGRESHFDLGKYGVMPGDNLEGQLAPFIAGLDSAGAMTSYSIILDKNGEPYFGNEKGTAYDKARIDILRDDNNYDGIIVTDWRITKAGAADPDSPMGTPWGMEEISVDERHFDILKNGIDQFGGNTEIEPVLAAYDMWVAAFEAGELEVDADTRWAETGRRVLTTFFNVGLYDDPFQDLKESEAVVGSDEYLAAGEEAQRNSVVVVKNDAETIMCEAQPAKYEDMTVYIPRSFDTGRDSFLGPGEYKEDATFSIEAAEQYFDQVVTDEVVLDDNDEVAEYIAPDLSDVDLVLVGMRNPDNGSYIQGFDAQTGEYLPVSLQYRPYTADGENVRKTSIGGNTLEDGSKENRSYFENTSAVTNESNLDAFERAVTAIADSGKDIPLISIIEVLDNVPTPAEFEADSDAMIVNFGVSDAAVLDVALGIHESSGRLPITMPKDMDSVEASLEDIADTVPFKDSLGNEYSFGFGLSCGGTPIQ